MTVKPGAKITFDYGAGVDGLVANPQVFSDQLIQHKVDAIQRMIDTGHFNHATAVQIREAISPDNITAMKQRARRNGADEGNRNLFVARNFEGIQKLLEQADASKILNPHGDQVNASFDFDFSKRNSNIDFSSSLRSGDVTHRMFHGELGIDIDGQQFNTPVPSIGYDNTFRPKDKEEPEQPQQAA